MQLLLTHFKLKLILILINLLTKLYILVSRDILSQFLLSLKIFSYLQNADTENLD